MSNIPKNTIENLPNRWLRIAWVQWPNAEEIVGDGAFAAVCPHGPWPDYLLIAMCETEQEAREQADDWRCYQREESEPCTGEPVWISSRDLEKMDLPPVVLLPHDIVDLRQLVSEKPELEEAAKSIELPDPDWFEHQTTAWMATLQRQWDFERKTRALPLIDSTALSFGEYKAPEFLVQYLIPKQGLTLLAGDSGSAKTSLALHMSVAIATGQDVSGLFATKNKAKRPVLYLNGEMGPDDLRRFLAQAIAGVGKSPPPGSLAFFGKDGVADFGFSGKLDCRSELFEIVLDHYKPCLVVFDSLRALAEIDEVDQAQVRAFFTWLRRMSIKYNFAIMVLHHLRKLGQMWNNSRERVAGSRDLIASCDIHIAAISKNGAPMHELELGKTRLPWNGVSQGTRWPIKAQLVFFSDQTKAPKSLFVAQSPQAGGMRTSAVDASKEELRDLMRTVGPQTRQQLGADEGSRKRAFESMRRAGEIVEAGRLGRKKLFALATAA